MKYLETFYLELENPNNTYWPKVFQYCKFEIFLKFSEKFLTFLRANDLFNFKLFKTEHQNYTKDHFFEFEKKNIAAKLHTTRVS